VNFREIAYQECIHVDCRKVYAVDEVLTSCLECGSLLDVKYDWKSGPAPESWAIFQDKWSQRLDPLARSGVWPFVLKNRPTLGGWSRFPIIFDVQ
jgi:hypothetical protein